MIFEEEHNRTFNQLIELFSAKPLFPSKTDVLGVRRDLSPATRKDEQDIRPFVRSAIEKPAERVVAAYLQQTGSTVHFHFHFQNNAYSLENKSPEKAGEHEVPPPSMRGSPERKAFSQSLIAEAFVNARMGRSAVWLWENTKLHIRYRLKRSRKF